MGTGAVSDREAITAALDRFDAAQAELAALSFDALTGPEVLTVKDRLQTVERRQAAVDHRLTKQLTCQASPVELGGKSWTDVLSNRLRIGRGAARRRLDAADDLAPQFAVVFDSLDVYAHLSSPAPRFWFMDSVALEQFLASELEYGLQTAVEAGALATINGTSGIMLQVHATSPLVVLRKSLTTLTVQGYDPAFLRSIQWIGRPASWHCRRRTVSSITDCLMTQVREGFSVFQSSCRTLKPPE